MFSVKLIFTMKELLKLIEWHGTHEEKTGIISCLKKAFDSFAMSGNSAGENHYMRETLENLDRLYLCDMRLINVAPGYLITVISKAALVNSKHDFDQLFLELKDITLNSVKHGYFNSADKLILR